MPNQDSSDGKEAAVVSDHHDNENHNKHNDCICTGSGFHKTYKYGWANKKRIKE